MAKQGFMQHTPARIARVKPFPHAQGARFEVRKFPLPTHKPPPLAQLASTHAVPPTLLTTQNLLPKIRFHQLNDRRNEYRKKEKDCDRSANGLLGQSPVNRGALEGHKHPAKTENPASAVGVSNPGSPTRVTGRI
eukprot:TRINITY_DN1312_c0_g1_i2.p11 TRINITY_DN1312_c0_g1~~TRINITY_DN1312_c0_g1_i2.p11  ORF type:complete len:135 (-),score=8.09 TRINITY_DN1312_c0_g1_i2:210-614(-)